MEIQKFVWKINEFQIVRQPSFAIKHSIFVDKRIPIGQYFLIRLKCDLKCGLTLVPYCRHWCWIHFGLLWNAAPNTIEFTLFEQKFILSRQNCSSIEFNDTQKGRTRHTTTAFGAFKDQLIHFNWTGEWHSKKHK